MKSWYNVLFGCAKPENMNTKIWEGIHPSSVFVLFKFSNVVRLLFEETPTREVYLILPCLKGGAKDHSFSVKNMTFPGYAETHIEKYTWLNFRGPISWISFA